MLIQFTVENFLSFKEKTVFSLLATSDDSHPDHLIPLTGGKNRNILRTAAVYGPNASGKSNLIKAMKFARDLILEGTEPDKYIAVSPYRLGPGADQPSRFQFIFTHRGIEYSYGFAVNSVQILDEFLYATPAGKELKYFERVTSDEFATTVEFGPSLKKGSSSRRQFLKYKAADTRSNQLLLTAIFEGNLQNTIEELDPVRRWFKSALTIIEAEAIYPALALRTHDRDETEAKDFLAALLRASDTGIQDIITKEIPLDWDRDLPGLPSDTRDQILRNFTRPNSDESNTRGLHGIVVNRPDNTSISICQNEKGDLVLLRMFLKHAGEDGDSVSFRINDESDGTQRLAHLGPALFDMIEGRTRVVVIDELDHRLHPHVSRLIVQLVLQCEVQGQLLFTTHDTNLLDLELLRRDEIWFVEKDKAGRSALYSLAEFKIRPDLQIEKGYLNGRFGAIPFIGDINSLGWHGKPDLEKEESVHA